MSTETVSEQIKRISEHSEMRSYEHIESVLFMCTQDELNQIDVYLGHSNTIKIFEGIIFTAIARYCNWFFSQLDRINRDEYIGIIGENLLYFSDWVTQESYFKIINQTFEDKEMRFLNEFNFYPGYSQLDMSHIARITRASEHPTMFHIASKEAMAMCDKSELARIEEILGSDSNYEGKQRQVTEILTGVIKSRLVRIIPFVVGEDSDSFERIFELASSEEDSHELFMKVINQDFGKDDLEFLFRINFYPLTMTFENIENVWCIFPQYIENRAEATPDWQEIYHIVHNNDGSYETLSKDSVLRINELVYVNICGYLEKKFSSTSSPSVHEVRRTLTIPQLANRFINLNFTEEEFQVLDDEGIYYRGTYDSFTETFRRR